MRAKESAITGLAQLYVELGWPEKIKLIAENYAHKLGIFSKPRLAKITKGLVDYIAKIPNSQKLQIELSLWLIEWCVAEKRTYLKHRIEVRLAGLYLEVAEPDKAMKIIEPILIEVRKADDKLLLVELYLLESKINYRVRNFAKAKASLTASRANANNVYCQPAIIAEIDLMSGILYAQDQDYKTSYSYFYEALEPLLAAKDSRAVLCFKYMLMCKVMSNNKDDFQSLLNGKFGLKFAADSHIQSIKAVADSHFGASIVALSRVFVEFKTEIEGDEVVNSHTKLLYDNLLEKNLFKIIDSYTRVDIEYIAKKLSLTQDVIERKLSEMYPLRHVGFWTRRSWGRWTSPKAASSSTTNRTRTNSTASPPSASAASCRWSTNSTRPVPPSRKRIDLLLQLTHSNNTHPEDSKLGIELEVVAVVLLLGVAVAQTHLPLHHHLPLPHLQRGALVRSDHQHRPGALPRVVGDLPEVVLEQVVEVAVVVGLADELLGEGLGLLVEAGVGVGGGVDEAVEVCDLASHFEIHGAADPPHLILVDLLDVADALEDVGYIVDPALLHAQLARGLVNIQNKVFLALYQPREPLRQQRQRVLPLPLPRALLLRQVPLELLLLHPPTLTTRWSLVYHHFLPALLLVALHRTSSPSSHQYYNALHIQGQRPPSYLFVIELEIFPRQTRREAKNDQRLAEAGRMWLRGTGTVWTSRS